MNIAFYIRNGNKFKIKMFNTREVFQDWLFPYSRKSLQLTAKRMMFFVEPSGVDGGRVKQGEFYQSSSPLSMKKTM